MSNQATTTAAASQLSNINEEIKNVLNSINDFSERELNSDFNTREGYICANIKVYDYLDESDVLKIIKEANNAALSLQIIEEFNNERLQNIHGHTCENEASYLKEKYELNCDIMNFSKIFNVYNLAKRFKNKEAAILENKKLEYYINTYFERAQKYKTFKAYKNAIEKENKSEFKEYCKREVITFDCWQFGRSGGWFSICKKSELEQDFLYYYIGYDAHELLNEKNNTIFNEVVNNLLNYNETKRQFLARIESNLKGVQFLFNSVEEVINDIEEGKKHFKDNLLHELHHEITNFIEEAHETELKPNVSINIEGETVKTTMGVTVLLSDFKNGLIELMQQIKSGNFNENGYIPIKKKIGAYFVQFAQKIENDFIIKAGCHKFSLNNILSKITI